MIDNMIIAISSVDILPFFEYMGFLWKAVLFCFKIGIYLTIAYYAIKILESIHFVPRFMICVVLLIVCFNLVQKCQIYSYKYRDKHIYKLQNDMLHTIDSVEGYNSYLFVPNKFKSKEEANSFLAKKEIEDERFYGRCRTGDYFGDIAGDFNRKEGLPEFNYKYEIYKASICVLIFVLFACFPPLKYITIMVLGFALVDSLKKLGD